MNYETTIGLEVHAHLLTESKAFCACRNRFGDPPNTNTCPVCLGFPGSLPVLNREAIVKAARTALALNCKIAGYTKFDRKHYFYPDLPKNFQISQYDMPVGSNGSLRIKVEAGQKEIRIKRVHLEEDAAKLFHQKDSSLVDFNRGGTPLLEIVSEPDMVSPGEAYAYLTALKSILSYIGVSNCNMEEGSLRCDANISARPSGQKELGVKVELKNMNSFKWIKKALQYEAGRQIKILESGKKIIQDTRLWDEVRQVTHSMRTKEEAHDYRYFPEPDLLPFTLEKGFIDGIKESVSELPDEKRERFQKDYNLSEYDASVLTGRKDTADYFESSARLYHNPKILANWITQDVTSEINKRGVGIGKLGLTPENLAELLNLMEKGAITGKTAKEILPLMIDTNKSALEIMEEKNLVQIQDESALSEIVEKVIKANPKSVGDYKSGKANAIMFLVGQVMRESKGKANPGLVNKLLREKLINVSPAS